MFRRFLILAFVTLLALGLGSVYGQRLAIVAPESNAVSDLYAERLRDSLAASGAKVMDRDASDAAYRTSVIEAPFNMTTEQSRKLGETIGSDIFILINGRTQQRTSLEKRGYYESSAAVFVVSSRSGRLIHWDVASGEAGRSSEAEAGLFGSVDKIAGMIIKTAEQAYRNDLEPRNDRARFPELPPEGSVNARGLRAPIPYNRIKPGYTETVYLYDVRATVDVEVSIDETGKIADIDIVRWAGYGLDESVIAAVRSMNWRPAERNGKQLPMLILLRYNFTKIDKEDQ
jgi:TonB family protein